MDAPRFDAFTQQIADALNRRSLLRVSGAGALAVLLGRPPETVSARRGKRKGKQRRKRGRARKLKRNAFGCVPVGKPCRGKDKHCCSGVCKGKKPKKGKRDRSHCVGHDGSTCEAGLSQAFCGGEDVGCTTSADLAGVCNTTTGNASYCVHLGQCFDCRKDSDCREFCGPDAACIRCEAGCTDVGGTACAGPQACDFSPEE